MSGGPPLNVGDQLAASSNGVGHAANGRRESATGEAMSTEGMPKAILYSWITSVWATVPMLCLYEKGYSVDEYIIKQVDITKGENFSPAYLKINANGTVPTLVVPTSDTTSSDVQTRYRSLRDTMTICEFLDQARKSAGSRTLSDKPAPSLSPATIEGKTVSDALTALVHLPTVDPNFLYLSARNPEELQSKLVSDAGKFVTSRQVALDRHIAEAQHQLQARSANTPNSSSSHSNSQSSRSGSGSLTSGLNSETGSPLTFEARAVAFLQEKKEANNALYQIYHSQSPESQQGFFEASQKAWTESVPDALNKLEEGFKGPFVLGDHLSLADLHIVAWLARLVQISHGKSDAEGINELEKQLGEGKKIGPKVRAFWAAWLQRESFQKVWVGASSIDTLM